MFTGQGVKQDFGEMNPQLLESMDMSVIQNLETQYNDTQFDNEILG